MNFVIIRTFQNYFNAHIILTRLRSEGIDCFLRDEFTVTVDPVLSNAVGGIPHRIAVITYSLPQVDYYYSQLI